MKTTITRQMLKKTLSKRNSFGRNALIFLGIFASAIAYVTWTIALSKAKKTLEVSNYMFVTPFFATMLGFLLNHEVPTLSTAIGYRHWRTASTVFYFSHFIFVFIFIIVNKHLLPIHPWVKFGSVLALCLLTSEWMMRMSGRKGWQWLRYGF